MKISKAITEIYGELRLIEYRLSSYDTSKLEKLELQGRTQGLNTALEIIKKNM